MNDSKPTGTISFLFTDIEGSTRLWENYPQGMKKSFVLQEKILRDAIDRHKGYAYKMIGDAFQAAFWTPQQAIEAAVDAQRQLHSVPWGEAEIRVRMAIHTCSCEERGDDYVGPELNRVARLLGSGYGGQVLLTKVVYNQLADQLPDDVNLIDLGEHRLKDLILPEHIYQVVVQDLPVKFPLLKTLDVLPRRLRSQPTLFFGRQKEIADISTLLLDPDQNAHLISLIGPGGVGKTRLSLQVVGKIMEYFPDGVFYVELAGSDNAEKMVNAIAETIKLPLQDQSAHMYSLDEQIIRLGTFFTEKNSLLVLDNFDILIPYAPLLTEILNLSPGLRIIVTSRERLNLVEEWVFDISGLAYPVSSENVSVQAYPAIQMFIDCARRAGISAFNQQDIQFIANICRLVEGIPLALELAAAWVKLYAFDKIAQEIEASLDFLGPTLRGLPDRHKTLRAVFNYSWNFLSSQEAEVFSELSIFRDGFTLEAGIEVAQTDRLLISALIDKSLIRRLTSGRFAIHEVLRQFAAEKLTMTPDIQAEVRSRHAQFYVDWLYKMGDQLRGSDQFNLKANLLSDYQNLSFAWTWMVDHQQFQNIYKILLTMILIRDMYGLWQEGFNQLNILYEKLKLLDEQFMDPKTNEVFALTLAGLRYLGNLPRETRRSLQEQCMSLAERLPDNLIKSFVYLMNVSAPGALTSDEQISIIRECIKMFDKLGELWGMALAWLVLGDTHNFIRKSYHEAFQAYQTSLDIFNQLGNSWGKALCLYGLSGLEREEHHLTKALELSKECLDIYDRLGNKQRAFPVRHLSGELARELGDLDYARECYQGNLDYFTRTGNLEGQNYYQNLLAEINSQ